MLFGLVACSDDDYNLASIIIVNGTEYEAFINIISETDNVRKPILDSSQHNQVFLFLSYDETIDPCVLLSNECNGIVVTIDNPEKSKIFFGKHTTPNYSSNPFNDANAWRYDVETQESRYRNQEGYTFHVHTLVITTDNIVENTPN